MHHDCQAIMDEAVDALKHRRHCNWQDTIIHLKWYHFEQLSLMEHNNWAILHSTNATRLSNDVVDRQATNSTPLQATPIHNKLVHSNGLQNDLCEKIRPFETISIYLGLKHSSESEKRSAFIGSERFFEQLNAFCRFVSDTRVWQRTAMKRSHFPHTDEFGRSYSYLAYRRPLLAESETIIWILFRIQVCTSTIWCQQARCLSHPIKSVQTSYSSRNRIFHWIVSLQRVC